MATQQSAQQAVLSAIEFVATKVAGGSQDYTASMVKDLAEAFAWMKSTGQPH
jgi:hypothetical protein